MNTVIIIYAVSALITAWGLVSALRSEWRNPWLPLVVAAISFCPVFNTMFAGLYVMHAIGEFQALRRRLRSTARFAKKTQAGAQ